MSEGPFFLLPETVAREDGAGAEVALGASKGAPLLVTLGITRILEQESLDVSIRGSADRTTWGAKPLAAFPQKFYCGAYTLVLDLSAHSEVEYLRVEWKMARWGRGELKPLFGFYVAAQPAGADLLAPREAALTAG